MLKFHNASLSAFDALVEKMIPDWEIAGKSYRNAIQRKVVSGDWYVVGSR
jgi:hypothetical protein